MTQEIKPLPPKLAERKPAPILAIVVSAVVLGALAITVVAGIARRDDMTPPPAQRAYDAELQSGRIAAMQSMADEGLLSHHSADAVSARAVMTEAFFRLDDKAKGSVLGVIWGYYRDEKGLQRPVDVRLDNGSVVGRPMGTYGPIEGYVPAD